MPRLVNTLKALIGLTLAASLVAVAWIVAAGLHRTLEAL